MVRFAPHLMMFLLTWHLFLSSAFAQEFLSGQVIDVKPETMEIVLGLKADSGNDTDSEQTIVIRPAEDNILPLQSGKPVFPECVIKGDYIKIWGDWDDDKETVFLAHDIRGCKGGGCFDPTGIMSRLKRSHGARGHHMNRSGSGSSGRGSRHRGGR